MAGSRWATCNTGAGACQCIFANTTSFYSYLALRSATVVHTFAVYSSLCTAAFGRPRMPLLAASIDMMKVKTLPRGNLKLAQRVSFL